MSFKPQSTMPKYLFLIIFLFSLISVNGQIKYEQGYYVNAKSDTIYGSVAIPVQYINSTPNYELIQWKVLFIEKDTDVVVIEPSNVYGYGFFNKNGWHHYKPVINRFGVKNRFNPDENHIFVRFEVEGKLNLISFYESSMYQSFGEPDVANQGNYATSGGGNYANKKMYLLKKGKKLQEIRKLNFRKDIKQFFSTHPELHPTISTLRRRDIYNLVAEYNRKKANC